MTVVGDIAQAAARLAAAGHDVFFIARGANLAGSNRLLHEAIALEISQVLSRRHRCDDLLEQFKITHIRKSRAGSLSGGERGSGMLAS